MLSPCWDGNHNCLAQEFQDALTLIHPFPFLMNDVFHGYFAPVSSLIFSSPVGFCLLFKEAILKQQLIGDSIMGCLKMCTVTLQMQMELFPLLIQDFDIQLPSHIFLWVFFKLAMTQVCTGSFISSLSPTPSRHSSQVRAHNKEQ